MKEALKSGDLVMVNDHYYVVVKRDKETLEEESIMPMAEVLTNMGGTRFFYVECLKPVPQKAMDRILKGRW